MISRFENAEVLRFDDDSDSFSEPETRPVKSTSKRTKENALSSIEMKFDDIEEEAKTLEQYRQMKYAIS